MILPDVNVLIYAFRRDSPYHALCRPWLERLAGGDSMFGLSKLALSAVVRVTTNRRAFPDANTLQESFEFCNWLLGAPTAVALEPGDNHWAIFEKICRDTDTAGPRVSDVWFAALAIEHGCEFVTLDRDFARFPGLQWRTPE